MRTKTIVPAGKLALLGWAGCALVAVFAFVGLAAPTAQATQDPAVSPSAEVAAPLPVEMEIYVDRDCVNCKKQREWLEKDVIPFYPNLTIVEHELRDNEQNKSALVALGKEHEFPTIFTPTTVLNGRIWVGFTKQIGEDQLLNIERASRGEPIPAGVYGQVGEGTCGEDALSCGGGDNSRIIDVPFFGEVNLGGKSMVFSSLVIGFVDGINPCSLWVISVLLAIVLRTGSRGRVIAVGTTFLTVTALMYALYMVAIYSAMSLVFNLSLIQTIVGLIALVFGLFALKDYFAFKQGPSLTISDSAKPGLYRRMRELAGHKSLLPALGATVVLAILVSLLETPCTAGFPLLWTGILHANGVGLAEGAGLFVVYMIPFLIDEFVVFALAVWTMRASKMQEKHGEILKLIAGTTMVALAIVMLLNPKLMEDPVIALLLFVFAFGVAALVHWATTRIKSMRAAAAEELAAIDAMSDEGGS